MNDRTDVPEIAAPVDLVAASEDLRPLVERHAAEATRAHMLSPVVVDVLQIVRFALHCCEIGAIRQLDDTEKVRPHVVDAPPGQIGHHFRAIAFDRLSGTS